MDYARTLMMEKNFALKYWKEAMNTTVYTLNRVQIRQCTNLTPYELWFCYTPSVKCFKIFGNKCYILKDDMQGKLDAKGEEGILLGYSTKRKA